MCHQHSPLTTKIVTWPGLVILLMAWGPRAMATPSDLEVRVSDYGLDFVAEQVPKLVPKHHNLGDAKFGLMGCPFVSDTDMALTSPQIDLDIQNMSIEPGQGSLTITFGVAASGTVKAKVSHIGCIPGTSLSCNVAVGVQQSMVKAVFTPVMQNGSLRLVNPKIDVDIPSSKASIKLSGCSLGTSGLLNLVVDRLKGWIVDRVTSAIEDRALDEIPDAVESALKGFTSMGAAMYGYSVKGNAEQLSVAPGSLSFGVGLDIATTKTAACKLQTAPPLSKIYGSPSFSMATDHAGIAVSRTVFEEAARAVWKSGQLCLPYSQLKGLGLSSGVLGAGALLLGLDTATSIDVRAPKAPVVTLVSGIGGRATIRIPDMEVVIKGTGAQGPTTITSEFDALLDVNLAIDPISRSVKLESVKGSAAAIKMSASPKGLPLDADLFRKLLEDVVLPLIQSEIEGTRLLPQVLQKNGGVLDPYYLYLTRSNTTPSHVQMYARVFARPTFDGTAPTTYVTSRPAALIRPQVVRLVASGYDSLTPKPLLRFSWRVDGGSWSAPSYEREHLLAVDNGKHVIEARATDLNGNTDLTPVDVTFDVDGMPPGLRVTSAPQAPVLDGKVQIAVVANDDHTPADKIEIKVEVLRVTLGGNGASSLRKLPFAPGRDRISLTGLTDGRYNVVLVARDSVGNVSQQVEVGFVVGDGSDDSPWVPEGEGAPTLSSSEDPVPGISGGCAVGSAAGSAAGTSAPLLLVLVALVALGRRRAVARKRGQ